MCFNTSTGQNFGVKMQTVKKCEFAVFKKMRLGLWCALATLHALMCGQMRMTSEITEAHNLQSSFAGVDKTAPTLIKGAHY